MSEKETKSSSSSTTILNETDEYFLKDIMFVEDNIICLVKPREQHFFTTKEYTK